MRKRHWKAPLAGIAVGVVVGLIVWGCSGPQPLSVAMRTADEQAYRDALQSHEDSPPKEAFFAMKAAQTGQSVEAVRAADAELSETSNPFHANSDPSAVSRGAVVYQAHCVRCHGADARGDGPDVMPGERCKDFQSFGTRFGVTLHGGAPRAWYRKIRDGAGGDGLAMPAFGQTLSREQIWLVITYLQSLDAYAPKNAPATSTP